VGVVKGQWSAANGYANVKSSPGMTWSCIALLTVGTREVQADAFKTIKSTVSMEACRMAVLRQRPGKITKVEFKTERRIPMYEFEIAGSDGKTWEIECAVIEGRIVEEEQEVETVDDTAFKGKAKIAEEEARRIALKAHPGTVVEAEYEIESNGNPSYEFDIRLPDGREIKLEVDAVTGRIIEDEEEEFYQIDHE
jgi:uncharacterized membrane protein YkoI